MGQHPRHNAPTRRRERKTVFSDSRWKISVILPQIVVDPQGIAENKRKEIQR